MKKQAAFLMTVVVLIGWFLLFVFRGANQSNLHDFANFAKNGGESSEATLPSTDYSVEVTVRSADQGYPKATRGTTTQPDWLVGSWNSWFGTTERQLTFFADGSYAVTDTDLDEQTAEERSGFWWVEGGGLFTDAVAPSQATSTPTPTPDVPTPDPSVPTAAPTQSPEQPTPSPTDSSPQPAGGSQSRTYLPLIPSGPSGTQSLVIGSALGMQQQPTLSNTSQFFRLEQIDSVAFRVSGGSLGIDSRLYVKADEAGSPPIPGYWYVGTWKSLSVDISIARTLRQYWTFHANGTYDLFFDYSTGDDRQESGGWQYADSKLHLIDTDLTEPATYSITRVAETNYFYIQPLEIQAATQPRNLSRCHVKAHRPLLATRDLRVITWLAIQACPWQPLILAIRVPSP